MQRGGLSMAKQYKRNVSVDRLGDSHTATNQRPLGAQHLDGILYVGTTQTFVEAGERHDTPSERSL